MAEDEVINVQDCIHSQNKIRRRSLTLVLHARTIIGGVWKQWVGEANKQSWFGLQREDNPSMRDFRFGDGGVARLCKGRPALEASATLTT